MFNDWVSFKAQFHPSKRDLILTTTGSTTLTVRLTLSSAVLDLANFVNKASKYIVLRQQPPHREFWGDFLLSYVFSHVSYLIQASILSFVHGL